MASVTISTPNVTRINDCDDNSGWENIGGGKGLLVSTTSKQGVGSIARRIDNGDKGFAFKLNTPLNFKLGGANFCQKIYFWVKVDDPEKLNSMRLRLATNGPTQNWREWEVEIPAVFNDWIRVEVDPSLPHFAQDVSGAGDTYEWIGFMFDMGNAPAGKENCFIDAVDVGTGITVSGGTSSDPIDWDDIAANDDYGFVRTVNNRVDVLGDLRFENAYLQSTDAEIFLHGGTLSADTLSSLNLTGGKIEGLGVNNIDLRDAEAAFVNMQVIGVVGEPFSPGSVMLNSLVALSNVTFDGCGDVDDGNGLFTEINKQPQPNVFEAVYSNRVNTVGFLDGTSELSNKYDEFIPFDSATDNAGDEYYFGAPVQYAKMVLGDDLFATLGVNWEYWNGSAWVAIGITNNPLHGEIDVPTPADWATTSVNGSAALYYIRVRLDNLGFVSPDPRHRIAYYVPA